MALWPAIGYGAQAYGPMGPAGAFDPYDSDFGMEDIPVVGPSNTELIDRHILHTYLPALPYSSLSYSGRLDLRPIINQIWASRCGQVQRRIIHSTVRHLLRSLSTHTGHSEAPTLELLDLLESSLYQRPSQANYLYPARRLPYTYGYFTTLLDLAVRFASPRLHSVLYQFFSKHGGTIARTERITALIDWASAIIRSRMRDSDIIACLREIILARPGFVESLHACVPYGGIGGGVLVPVRRGGPSATRVLEVLRNVQEVQSRMYSSGGAMGAELMLERAAPGGLYRRGNWRRAWRGEGYGGPALRWRAWRPRTILPRTLGVAGALAEYPYCKLGMGAGPMQRELYEIKNDVRVLQHQVSDLREDVVGSDFDSDQEDYLMSGAIQP